jgi:hypothetical protein
MENADDGRKQPYHFVMKSGVPYAQQSLFALTVTRSPISSPRHWCYIWRMTRRTPYRAPLDVSVEVAGTRHQGTYVIDGKTITVWFHGRSKTTQLGGSTPEVLARLILAELVRENRGSPS